MLDRRNFDDETLAAMDEIAALLHIKTAVSEMSTTFKNSDKLDVGRAGPSAKRVMKAAREAAEDLLKEAFVRKRKRSFRETRLRHVTQLVEAVKYADLLTRQEYGANPEVEGKGVFDLHVLRPLRELTERWQATVSE